MSEETAGTGTGGPDRRKGARRFLPSLLFFLLAVALSLYGARFYVDGQNYVTETDARIVAEEVLISSEVAGRLITFPIGEGQAVVVGEALGEIDGRATRQQISRLRAQLETIAAEGDRLAAEIALVDAATGKQIQAARSKLAAARALAASFAHEHKFARSEFERAQALVKNAVISRQQLDLRRNSFLKSEQALLRAEAEVAAAEAAFGEAESERRRLEILRRQQAVLDSRAAETHLRVKELEIDLEDRVIKSPLQGVVSRTFANPGEYVNPGQRLALVHQTHDLWIEAKVKETEFTRIALGQKVDVLVDALPDMSFSGKVTRKGHATTAEFALLPTPNPSGTFTKVTQRLPIRIRLDKEDERLKPGMMVEIRIAVRQP